MAAVLHVAYTHQAPPPPKRKRKDGDGGGPGEFDRYATRIYRDERANHEAKELLLALAYVLTHERGDDKPFTAASKLLGQDRIGGWRIRKLILNDVPRYESPVYRSFAEQDDELFKRCAAPRLRPFREPESAAQPSLLSLTDDGAWQQMERPVEDFRNRLKVCGADASDYVIERLPETGWHKAHWFCTRHRGEMERTRRQLVEPNKLAPKPVPNTGGLMPCYFESDWEYVYRYYAGERWEPPVYGLRADDWPIPGKEPVPQRARLRLAAVDGELLGGAS